MKYLKVFLLCLPILALTLPAKADGVASFEASLEANYGSCRVEHARKRRQYWEGTLVDTEGKKKNCIIYIDPTSLANPARLAGLDAKVKDEYGRCEVGKCEKVGPYWESSLVKVNGDTGNLILYIGKM